MAPGRLTGRKQLQSKEANSMSDTVWMILGVAALLVVVYLLIMRIFFRQSRELDKKIDPTKMKRWKDDDK